MSRVAKAPVIIPSNVTCTLDDNHVVVKGPKGTITHPLHKFVKISQEEGKLVLATASNDPNAWAQAGTMRAVLNNMVVGVTNGFSITLELVGVGYRAQAKGKQVSLSLGFSHPIEYDLPEGVTVETPNVTTIILSGIDKHKVGQVAAEIRAFRSPEPYKGKGIKYANEKIIRKEAKKK